MVREKLHSSFAMLFVVSSENTALFNFEDSKFVSKVQILPLEYTVKNNKFISPQLALLLEDNFNKGKQSLLLINRLGFAGAYSCVFCNTLTKCKKCGAVLSHQKTAKGEILFCKKCGAKESETKFARVAKTKFSGIL